MRNPRNEALSPDIAEGRRARESGPERRCILTGDNAPRDALVRLAISPEGPDGTSYVLPDALARAPGRGAWIGVTRDALSAALANGKLKGALARAFKGARIVIPEALPDMVEQALTRAFLDRLGLEMRAGKLILGTDRIAEQARMGGVAWLAHAADAAEDGSRKLDQAWRVGMEAEGSGMGGIRLPLDRAALSVALGRDNVVHLALAERASAERVALPLRRLLHFTGAIDSAADDIGERTDATARRAGADI